MRVLHINSFDDNGGAARAAVRLHRALIQEGIHSDLAVNVSHENQSYIKKLSYGTFGVVKTFVLRAFEHFAVKALVKPLKIPFSMPFFGKDIRKNKWVQQADIIHLHWINQGFLTSKSLKSLVRTGIPIVWTMHDSFAFTGGCHVRYDCTHYMQQCGNCPLLKVSKANDWSHYFWEKKKAAYADLDISIIAPSKWMAESVGKSSLLVDKKVDIIPNAIDTQLFKPSADRDKLRKALGWKEDEFVVLSGFMPSKVDLHKGSAYLFKALTRFSSFSGSEKVKVVFFGGNPDNNIQDLLLNLTFLGRIDDDKELASYYAAADVFLTTSIEDNLPNTVMESLACGTPVVAFETGGIPDMVLHELNGYLAEFKSADDIADGLQFVRQFKYPEVLRNKARMQVLEHFAAEVIAKKHIELYKCILEGR